MRTTRMWALAVLAIALFAAGCGGDDSGDSTTAADEAPTTLEEISVDSGPFDSDDEFLSAAQSACDDYEAILDRAPVYGLGAEGIAAEFEFRSEVDSAFQDGLESIEPTDSLADDWQAFLDAGAKFNEIDEKVLEAAQAGDAEKANAILTDSASVSEDYGAAADQLGVCSTDVDLGDEFASATDAAADAAQPDNTVDDAVEEYLTALKSGDCKQIADANHSQNYAEPAEDCSDLAKSEKETENLGSTQFGPVGAAMVGTSENAGYLSFVLDPKTGGLMYTGTVYTGDSGLRPANEGIDSDETIAASLDAIRADDVDAFNETLPIDVGEGEGAFTQTGDTIETLGSDPVYQDRIISDIKEDTEAEPVLLGANQVQAYYLLDTEKTDYILTTLHDPGSETHYAFNSYWAITE